MGSDKVLPVPLDTRARRQPGGGGEGMLGPDRPMCVHVRMCACVMLLLSCGDGRLHQESVPSLDAAWNTWARLGVSRTQDTREGGVFGLSLSLAHTVQARRQDERVAVWRDMAADEFLFHGPCSVG